MLTNEKRHEVAQRLQEIKKTGFCSTWCKICMEVRGPDCPVECDEDEMAIDVAKRLSDLIEPEPKHCVKRYHGTDNNYMQCWSCSECNAGWFEDINDKPFSFCPHCGAKVIGTVVS